MQYMQFTAKGANHYSKSTSELTAVAQTPECRYHLGLGINNVQVAVNGMDGDKRSHLLSLCGWWIDQWESKTSS